MSLVISFNNHHGIVMSADKLVTSTYAKDNQPCTIHGSCTEQKLFLVENKYGLSYTGTSSVDNIPISALIEEYISQHSVNNNPPIWLLEMANYFHLKMEQIENANCVFIFCGYHNDSQFVLTTNTMNPEVTDSTEKHCLIYSGESILLDHLINSDLIAFDYSKFTMQDSVDFLRFLNETVSGLMYFGQILPTVSKECDILAIYPNETRWVTHDTLH